MLKRISTFHEFLDDTGRRFVVRLASAMQVATVETALGRERIEWQKAWGRYSPLSEDTAAKAVEEFCRRQQRHQPMERANAELLHPPAPKSGLTFTRNHTVRPAARAGEERQLPKGDRS
jgi:hypothetical protein